MLFHFFLVGADAVVVCDRSSDFGLGVLLCCPLSLFWYNFANPNRVLSNQAPYVIETSYKLIAPIHYYFPKAKIGSQNYPFNIDTDLDPVIERLKSEKFDGWLYMGMDNEIIKQRLFQVFQLQLIFRQNL